MTKPPIFCLSEKRLFVLDSIIWVFVFLRGALLEGEYLYRKSARGIFDLKKNFEEEFSLFSVEINFL